MAKKKDEDMDDFLTDVSGLIRNDRERLEDLLDIISKLDEDRRMGYIEETVMLSDSLTKITAQLVEIAKLKVKQAPTKEQRSAEENEEMYDSIEHLIEKN